MTDDIVEHRKTLTIVTRWIYVFLFLGGLLPPLLAYLITRKQCKVRYFLSRSLRNRLRYRLADAWLAFLLMVGGIAISISTADDLIFSLSLAAFISALVCLFLFLILLYLASAPLSILRHQKGQQFWLKGFQPPFLSSCDSCFPHQNRKS